MFSVLFIVIMNSAFVAAMAAGAVISFLLAVALSVAALGAGFLRWPEELIWTAQLAAPVLLIPG